MRTVQGEFVFSISILKMCAAKRRDENVTHHQTEPFDCRSFWTVKFHVMEDSSKQRNPNIIFFDDLGLRVVRIVAALAFFSLKA